MKPGASLLARVRADGQTYNQYLRGRNAIEPIEPRQAQHGNQIFMYRNIRTNQVVYSLTRSLNNHAALKQLPFLGKKTVPARIRKDLWLPFVLVEFPSPLQGLNAYRKLREFRRLHETSYDLSTIKKTSGSEAGNLLNTKWRGKVLMNQRANSVADLAAVLWQAKEGPSQERKDYKERSKRRWETVKRQKKRTGKEVPKRNPHSAIEAYGVEGVRIRWADELDRDYAEKWPEPVAHHLLERHRYTAAFPAYAMKDQDPSFDLEALNKGQAAPQPSAA